MCALGGTDCLGPDLRRACSARGGTLGRSNPPFPKRFPNRGSPRPGCSAAAFAFRPGPLRPRPLSRVRTILGKLRISTGSDGSATAPAEPPAPRPPARPEETNYRCAWAGPRRRRGARGTSRMGDFGEGAGPSSALSPRLRPARCWPRRLRGASKAPEEEEEARGEGTRFLALLRVGASPDFAACKDVCARGSHQRNGAWGVPFPRHRKSHASAAAGETKAPTQTRSRAPNTLAPPQTLHGRSSARCPTPPLRCAGPRIIRASIIVRTCCSHVPRRG